MGGGHETSPQWGRRMAKRGAPKKLLVTSSSSETWDSNQDPDSFLEEDSKSVIDPSVRRKHGFLNYLRTTSESFSSGLGRFQGALLNKLVKTGMQTPIVKYLLSPQTLKKALNNDPVLKETYRIIFQSEPVQNLMTPEAMKIILDSDTAKQTITTANVMTVLNSDIIANFITPENIAFILNTEIIRKVFRPEALSDYLESESVKKFLRPEIIHEVVYSQMFNELWTQDMWVTFLNSSGVRAVMTQKAINDALESPAARRTMNQEIVDMTLSTEGAQNLVAHPDFRGQFYRFVRAIDKL